MKEGIFVVQFRYIGFVLFAWPTQDSSDVLRVAKNQCCIHIKATGEEGA